MICASLVCDRRHIKMVLFSVLVVNRKNTLDLIMKCGGQWMRFGFFPCFSEKSCMVFVTTQTIELCSWWIDEWVINLYWFRKNRNVRNSNKPNHCSNCRADGSSHQTALFVLFKVNCSKHAILRTQPHDVHCSLGWHFRAIKISLIW